MPYVPPKGARTITPVTVATQTAVSGINNTNAGGTVVINGVNAAIQFQDEGTPIGTSGLVSSVDFVGSGVTATAVGNAVTVTIPGGTGAPTNAEYVVTSPDATLTNERVTTNTTQILWDTSTPGQLKATVGAISEGQVTNLTTDLAAKQDDITFSDEGTPLSAPGVITTVNFTGTGVTASAIGTAMTVAVPGGAPTNAEYVVTSANGTLTNERVTTDTTEILWDTTTPGQLRATVGAITKSQVTGLTTDLAAKQDDITFSDEGTPLSSAGVITSVNFVGSGVTASAIGTAMTVTIPGAPTSAPVNAEYIVSSADSTLTNERVTTNTTQILWDTSTAGQLKANVGAIGQGQVTNLITDLAAKQAAVGYQDEGASIGAAGTATTVNFVGSGVTASQVGSTVTVSIPGGGGGSSNGFDYLFGDGSDGNLTVTGLTTLSNTFYYQDVTVTGTGTLKPNGNRLHVNGTLTVQSGGKINTDGNAATASAGASGLSATAIVLGSSGAGGTGGIGTQNGVTAAGSLNNSSINPAGVTAKGGTGGGAGTFTGGAGYTPGAALWYRKINLDWQFGFRVQTVGNVWTGGGGGGGGASNNASSQGGGGGGGASNMWIAARNISNSGTISCNGGAGANATGTDAGGGGGGGGGNLWLITKSAATGTVTVAGGLGGSGVGTGGAGSTGTAGSLMIVTV